MAVRALQSHDTAAAATAADLQAIVVDLIALSLEAKQAHWNVRGPLFRPLHEMFDEFTDAYRGWGDDVAERLTAIGAPADGRPATVAAASKVRELPGGFVTDADAVRLVLAEVEGLAARLRARLDALGEHDLATQDLVIEIVRGLEKQAWMLRSSRA